ncbi:radical SAM protein [Rhodocytophaga rosea]|uniref:Radical SAM protein n=1 Tax=Rhodocytophaga rosea TaxID=2704465 RepID=A0A6C0GPU9_9BACT|nr:radical SAM protein [Rhodocytophaga rosea]QHT69633.1 radical SAM protein [Rhodocytophaga rosea]
MKLLLTHAYFLAEDAKEQLIMKPYPPLGILYLSAYLKKHGFNCQVYDTTFSTQVHFYEYLLAHTPDMIAIYTNLMTKLNVLRTIQFIRQQEELKHTTVILGGPEVTNHVNNFLDAGADIIAIGEGEQTMLDLMQAYQGSTAPVLEQIQGIAFKNNRRDVIQTTEREKLKNLDELPIPDREAIDLHKYLNAWKTRHGQNAISVSTMRGCPYTCKWCSRAVYGLSYRRRSPQKVVEEMLYLKARYNPDTLWFVDDVFTISHKWLREFAVILKENNIRIPYECISRSDRMNEEVIDLLKETGCYRIWIGAESGSQAVIDAMDRRVQIGQVREMIQLAKKKGIQTGTFIMLGYPGETEADIEETIQHLKISDPDYYTITLAYPIKGTQLYTEVEDKFLNPLPWESSTDRDIEYKRSYSPAYYHYALKRVNSEVAFHREKKKVLQNPVGVMKLKAKSQLAKLLMTLEKMKES